MIPLASLPVVQPAANAMTVAASTTMSIGSLTIKTAATAFLAAHPRQDDGSALSGLTPKTRSQFEAAIFLAFMFYGDTPVAAIDATTLADFVGILRKRPQNRTRRLPMPH